MFRIKWAGLLGLTMLLLTVVVCLNSPLAQSAVSLTDIANHPAYTEINYLFGQGIISGDPGGIFRPDEQITRAEFIALVNRAFGYTATTTIAFSDVKTGDWYYQDLAKAVQAGYITGFNDGTVRPFAAVTRQEAAAVMARILELDPAQKTMAFTDTAIIPSWSQAAIAAMVEKGFMETFSDGTFRPFTPVSRAEAAVLIYRGIGPQVPATKISLDRASATLNVGEKLQLTAAILPPDAAGQKVNWSSSNEKVAQVSSSGQVSAVAPGSCLITATTMEGKLKDTCVVTVKTYVPLRGVTLDKSAATTKIGRTITLYGSFQPANATNQAVRWSSSDTSVARVNNSGQVTGLREGTTIITVRTEEGGFSDSCRVNVNFNGYIDLSLDTLSMYLDRTPPRTLYARLFGDDSEVLGVVWESDDEKIAVVEYDPLSLSVLVKAVDTGDCTVSVEIMTQEGEYHDSCAVRILD